MQREYMFLRLSGKQNSPHSFSTQGKALSTNSEEAQATLVLSQYSINLYMFLRLSSKQNSPHSVRKASDNDDLVTQGTSAYTAVAASTK